MLYSGQTFECGSAGISNKATNMGQTYVHYFLFQLHRLHKG